MQNQIETLNLCVYFVVESIENAAHVLAIMGTNSLVQFNELLIAAWQQQNGSPIRIQVGRIIYWPQPGKSV